LKIKSVEPLLIDRFLYVRVETDNGYSGVGESGAWGHLEASAEAVRKFAEYLVGKDPRPIEHHWNVMQRFQHFSGAAINGAISAIDVALWDIKGKSLGVPVYELLGGAMRDKVRVYAHCKGKTPDKVVARARRLVSQGYTALGYLNPFLEEGLQKPWFRSHAARMREGVDVIRRVREVAGPDIDLCIEIHGRMKPGEAVTFARAVESFFPMFMEDPIRPYSADAMAWVADHSPVPIATGERFVSLHQFQTLLARRGVEFLRPCISVCGGITAGKKIAALAEAYDVQVVYHNPLSTINLAACLQLDACIPNFAIQETVPGDPEFGEPEGLRGAHVVPGLPAAEAGFMAIPNGPGLGIELPPDAEKRFPPRSMAVAMRPHIDGSVVEE
jgi:galactonate dehydratase